MVPANPVGQYRRGDRQHFDTSTLVIHLSYPQMVRALESERSDGTYRAEILIDIADEREWFEYVNWGDSQPLHSHSLVEGETYPVYFKISECKFLASCMKNSCQTFGSISLIILG